jgi:hypothetical protein
MICVRCGREQPTLASPCPDCGLLDSGAFNPGLTRPPEVVCAIDPHAGAETPESSKPQGSRVRVPPAGNGGSSESSLARDGAAEQGAVTNQPGDGVSARPLVPRPQPYFCKDCGRRFYNIGWHCEACGSSNYEPVSSGLEPQATEPSRVASDIASSPLGEATSSLGPELQLAFMRAHRAWAQRFQPWLLMDEEWLNA